MDNISQLLTALGPWAWIALAVGMLVLELVVPGIHFIWFGLAALIVGIAALAGLSGLAWQVAVFGVLSVAMILAVRLVFGSKISGAGDSPDLNERGRQYVGRVVVVEDAIEAGRGRVRVGDTLWQAKGTDAPKGAHVRITGIDGTVLEVHRA